MSLKLHRKLAGLFGYELIKKRKLNDTLEQHLGNLLESLRINCVLDVGANWGSYGYALRALGYTGRIVSFEPIQSTYLQLEQTSQADENWNTYRLALGRNPGTGTLNQCTASEFSSFHKPNKYGSGRFKWRIEVAGQEEVPISTLTEVWPAAIEGIAEPRVFLKLDTQGYDLEVLRGADKVIAQVFGVQTEIALQPIYQDMPGYLETLKELNNRDFAITGFYPVTRDKLTLAVIEYDCFMQRMPPI